MQVTRTIDREKMRFPIGSDVEIPELVRGYVDLRDRDWFDVDDVLVWETSAMDRLGVPQSSDDIQWQEPEEDELLPEDVDMTIVTSAMDFGVLDIGMVAAVSALSAAGCVTMVSCNGAVGHQYDCPLVVFYAPTALVNDLLVAAEEADCGLINGVEGMLELYATNVRNMVLFARVLRARCGPTDSRQAPRIIQVPDEDRPHQTR